MKEDQAQGHKTSGPMYALEGTQGDAKDVSEKAEVWTQKQRNQVDQ